ncbi:MAG: hypothetical protein ABIB11_06200 [Candidatus Omnitrophota bacterium]
MTNDELTWKIIKIGAISILVSIPLGLWAIPKFKPWLSAAILTAAGFAVKYVMLEHKELEHG